MRPFTTDQLHHASVGFLASLPPPTQQTAAAIMLEWMKYLEAQEPVPDPAPADALYLRGKEAYLKARDPFRGLSKRARAIAEKARDAVAKEMNQAPALVEPRQWKDQLAVWIQEGRLFAERGIGDGTIKELCRLATSPEDSEVKE